MGHQSALDTAASPSHGGNWEQRLRGFLLLLAPTTQPVQDRCTQEVHRKMASLLIVSVGNCKVFAEISPASCVVSAYSLCDECGLNI